MKLESIHGIHPHFYLGMTGLLLMILAQHKIEAALESQHAMPTTGVWQQRSPKHLSTILRIHCQLYPKSIWRSFATIGLGLFLFSIVVFFVES